MAAFGTSTITCPVCTADLEIPVSAIPYASQSGPTMYLSFDLTVVRDHVVEHGLGSAVATDLPLPSAARGAHP
ncbi:hypothetical protein ACIBAC_11600 [Streptomyces sp. NPDC051362]|uniref:hypothetical protein n=1 Tax=Streptomyces sp. NPDC051362 TaxID=3365651 RepID=UPI0037A30BD4